MGEGDCHITDGQMALWVPCTTYKDKQDNTFIAIRDPQDRSVVGIKQMFDGVQVTVWQRPPTVVPKPNDEVVPARRTIA